MTKEKMTIDKSMGTAVKLTQKSAKATLKSAVRTAEVSEDFVQDIYKAGYDANVDALKVVKGYWDASTNIRRDWVNLFAATTEAAIDSAPKMKIPFQKEALDLGKGIFSNISKNIEGFIPQTKSTK